ncbi:hypothetical protein GN958_ATG20438 [Phytophthora infestans]|uniref:Secreted RxLR effector peptide protein n=1 Tax=Phytophthora infestans TaxID=4787 RepID=A0A8S9TQX1_PHYIN|nr:hypothetical protein GN958_ATG20438 [Phytophthora infestans]
MGFYGGATLVTVAVLASSSTLAVVDPNTPDFLPYRSSAGVKGNALTPLLLRSNIQVDEGEERVAWLEQLKNWFKWDDAIVTGLMSKAETPHGALVSLGLSKINKNTLSDAKFGSWPKYVTKTNRPNWETLTISALRKKNTAAVVASMILAGKNGKSKAVAKKWEQAQFKSCVTGHRKSVQVRSG